MTHRSFITRDILSGLPLEGSAVFMENTVPWPLDKIVEKATGSPLAHVAVLLNCGGEPYIYEAFPPRVRKMPYREYVDEVLPKWEKQFWTRRLGGLNVFWWQPSKPLEQWRLIGMRAKAEELLGTPYNMLGTWFFDWDGPKIMHCSKYGGIIYQGGEMMVAAGGREDPGSVFRKLLEFDKSTRQVIK